MIAYKKENAPTHERGKRKKKISKKIERALLVIFVLLNLVLPHQHAEAVAVVVVPPVLHLYVLSNHVEPRGFQKLNVVHLVAIAIVICGRSYKQTREEVNS